MFNIVLSTLTLHDVYTGMFISKSEPPIDKKTEREVVVTLTMVEMGFKNEEEYLSMYPGNYKMNSALAVELGLDKHSELIGSYGNLTNFSCIQSVFIENNTADYLLRLCADYALGSIEVFEGKISSTLAMFPRVHEFTRCIPTTDNENNYTDRLWFCEDWKEGSTPRQI